LPRVVTMLLLLPLILNIMSEPMLNPWFLSSCRDCQPFTNTVLSTGICRTQSQKNKNKSSRVPWGKFMWRERMADGKKWQSSHNIFLTHLAHSVMATTKELRSWIS
jgi:hypothetical protein